ncbi:MAG: SufD family Fe-S cluster assembly protein [Nitrospinota bacterium]
MANKAVMKAADSPESLVSKNFQELQSGGKLNPVLSFLNSAAFERFLSMGYPRRANELFSFVNTRKLTSSPFACRYGPVTEPDADTARKNTVKGCEGSVMVIVDGKFNEKLSNMDAVKGSVVIKQLEESVSSGWVRQLIEESLNEEKDAFALLNSAFTAGGVVVDIADSSCIDAPILILHLSTAANGTNVMTSPRVVVRVGSGAKAGLLVKYAGLGGNFVNSFTDIVVEENAELNYSNIQLEPDEGRRFSRTRITIKKDGKFFGANGSSGGRLVRDSYEAVLLGEGAELGLNSVAVLRNDEQSHHFVRVRHEAPRCVSNQRFRNILKDNARASINTTVKAAPGAQETISTQMINNLMLSPDARADNKPNLMIFADDVQCTHGATVAQLNDNELLYLRSRGLPEEFARSVLTSSFARSIIDTVNYTPAAREMAEALLGKLEEKA